jgi:hypothetical protein
VACIKFRCRVNVPAFAVGWISPCVCGVGWDVCTPSPETVGAIHRSRERGFNHRTRYVYVRVHTSLVEIEIFMNAWPPVNLRA